MKLEDFPTPLTEEALETSAFENKNHPHTDWVPAHFARGLERKLSAARMALERIIGIQPSLEGGGCFYPMHDGEGNYIGEQHTDPLSVIQEMVAISYDALNLTKP